MILTDRNARSQLASSGLAPIRFMTSVMVVIPLLDGYRFLLHFLFLEPPGLDAGLGTTHFSGGARW